jgi:oxygen-independent coproporphyrinogen-3 oxidase
MVKAICHEINLQQNYLTDKQLQTIYFGGGTPSLLTENELGEILTTINQYFTITSDIEITLEANPDDLSKEKLQQLKSMGINRLSVGIQSFHENHLKFMHRVHKAIEAEACIKIAQDVGFENITIDLIYAIPSKDTPEHPHAIFENDLQKALSLGVPHISAYCLTIEPKTVFGNWQKKGKMPAINDEFAAQQFEILIDTLTANGYEHYEISNFAKPNHYSRHNTNYWKSGIYLGIGASAHSYNGQSRQFNVANNMAYMQSIEKNIVPFQKEELSYSDHINEYLMVSLRTIWGADTKVLREKYGYNIFEDKKNYSQLADYQKNGFLIMLSDAQEDENKKIILTQKGKLIADEITGHLFV